ncbi:MULTISPECIES: hypothetical protein [unclassified Ferrimonas]|uniref:hypothetical protein n=1 Tax=unclassified Ferrimonas TaxID=2620587 RepID=UPI0025723983|nr:hypothetical protein [Ferrimonas sp. YFM]BDY05490.1 hypothetical protein F0521_25310 [Ferrimonas sp. YFM]
MSSTEKHPLDAGPLEGRAQVDQEVTSGAVADMWLCLLTNLEQHEVNALGECNMALAFDLELAVRVAERECQPVASVMGEVLAFYNDKLALSLDCDELAPRLAVSASRQRRGGSQLH